VITVAVIGVQELVLIAALALVVAVPVIVVLVVVYLVTRTSRPPGYPPG